MSGGRFNYKQYNLSDMAEEIQRTIDTQGTEDEYGDTYATIPDDIIKKMKETIWECRMCENMLQRVDWFLSGDDGEDSFRERWDQEVTKKFGATLKEKIEYLNELLEEN